MARPRVTFAFAQEIQLPCRALGSHTVRGVGHTLSAQQRSSFQLSLLQDPFCHNSQTYASIAHSFTKIENEYSPNCAAVLGFAPPLGGQLGL